MNCRIPWSAVARHRFVIKAYNLVLPYALYSKAVAGHRTPWVLRRRLGVC